MVICIFITILLGQDTILTLKLFLKLAKKKENENIIGFKDSTSDVENTKAVIYKVLPEVPYFEVYSGFDSQFIANISSGGAGGISALSNIEPRLWSQWVQAAKDGDFKRIVSIQRKNR